MGKSRNRSSEETSPPQTNADETGDTPELLEASPERIEEAVRQDLGEPEFNEQGEIAPGEPGDLPVEPMTGGDKGKPVKANDPIPAQMSDEEFADQARKRGYEKADETPRSNARHLGYSEG